jgi:hypothetical protein
VGAHVLPENFHADTGGKNYTMMLIFQAGWQYAIFFTEAAVLFLRKGLNDPRRHAQFIWQHYGSMIFS